MPWQLVLRNDAGRLYHKRQRNASLGRHTLFISHQWFIVPHPFNLRQVLLSVDKLELMDQTQPAISTCVTCDLKNGFHILNDCKKYRSIFDM